MANGNTALRTLEPPSSPAPAHNKLDPTLERRIGAAVADASRALCAAAIGYQQTSMHAPATSEAGGAAIAEVVRLQMRYDGEIDFSAVARKRGREMLLPLVDAPEFTASGAETVVDGVINAVLTVARRVIAVEMAAMAN